MDAHDSHADHGETILAVDGQDIHFHFGRKKEFAVLNSVYFSVKQGTIYSLLGPSGCGKTTLLKCVIGQHKPQSGSLKVYGRSPGSKGFFIPGRGVGYMPQELALYTEMTIDEILTYFGTLYGMSMTHVRERVTLLVELLKLPNKKKLIQRLSGGQQRRVSFAIALIHKPPLLILDEPTVGVDPLLRKAVWGHLVNLAEKDHSTVIITTHYTEETRQAHTVGLMRNGHLLVERNPEELIKESGEHTLESVFLKVCQDNSNQDDNLETNVEEFIVDGNLSQKYLATNGGLSDGTATDESYANRSQYVNTSVGTFSKRNSPQQNTSALLPFPFLPAKSGDKSFRATDSRTRLFYLTKKNFLRLKRNIIFTLFTIAAAGLVVVVFFLCLTSGMSNIPVAVVNGEEGLNKFGEQFLLSISNRTICKKPFPNFTLAHESLMKGESSAVLLIPSEFSSCLVDRVLEGADASNDTILCSRIELVLDMSNSLIANTIRNTLWNVYQAFVTDVLRSVGRNPSLGKMPLHIEEHVYGSKPATIVDYSAPGLIMCVMYLMSIGLTEMCIISERKQGLLGRTLVAGATTTEVLVSFFFALLVMMLLQLGTMLLVAFCVFNLTCNGSVLWVVIAAALTGICGMSYGFLISAVTDDENFAGTLSLGTFFPLIFLSAGFWPLEAMIYYVRLFSYCLPLTQIIDSTRNVLARGWSITDNYIWDGYLICSA